MKTIAESLLQWTIFPLLFLLYMLPDLTEAKITNTCQLSGCHCVREGTVTCRTGNLQSIPTDFGLSTRFLFMIEQPFTDHTLRKRNLSYYPNLEQLVVKNCQLQRLEVGVFTDMKYLKSVDLTKNDIRVVYDYTFRGFRTDILFLNGNPRIKLQPRAFQGFQVGSLSLDSCGLSDLKYETFLHLNKSLHSLWLASNDITDFDPRFKLLFGHLKVLDVRNNPFRCKCRLRWLVTYLQMHGKKSDTGMMGPTSMEQPVCAYPPSLAGVELRYLKLNRLTCDPPRLGDIEVAMLSAEAGRLRCAASGYPLPVIEWRKKGSTGALMIKRPQSSILPPYSPPGIHAAEVGVTRARMEETYECLATNAGGNATLTVLLRWPNKEVVAPQPPNIRPVVPRIDKGPEIPTSTSGKNSWGTRTNVGTSGLDAEETNPFFQKKFTLLELIGAVVGTFTATLALFLLICRCITYARKKQKKQQWSTYESAYSGSHVYDVPRHDPSYMAAKTSIGTADRHEFLDYKTGRKVYDHV